jgi:hypothetical protein
VEQLVARWAHNPKAIRSSRIPATLKARFYLAFFMTFLQQGEGEIIIEREDYNSNQKCLAGEPDNISSGKVTFPALNDRSRKSTIFERL